LADVIPFPNPFDSKFDTFYEFVHRVAVDKGWAPQEVESIRPWMKEVYDGVIRLEGEGTGVIVAHLTGRLIDLRLRALFAPDRL
jgi:hypothetical protein